MISMEGKICTPKQLFYFKAFCLWNSASVTLNRVCLVRAVRSTSSVNFYGNRSKEKGKFQKLVLKIAYAKPFVEDAEKYFMLLSCIQC